MIWHRRFLFVAPLLLLSPVLFGQMQQTSPSAAKSRTGDLLSQLIHDPDDEELLDRYYRSLRPDKEGFVVVEGDLLKTRDELQDHIRQMSRERMERPASGPELLVNKRADGRDDYYAKPEDRTLTYSFNAGSFTSSELTKVKQWFKSATQAWTETCPECGIKFAEKKSGDPVWFKIRKNGDGRFLASAFFPHYAQARRYVNIDPTFFTTSISKTGILRHELGHVLGYRHEHIRGIPGCYSEGGAWRPLTSYDPKSVMHYFCGGSGSILLQLTERDKQGHRLLYAPASGPGAFVAPASAMKSDATKRYEAALSEASSVADGNAPTPAFDAYKSKLPKTRSGDYFIVEGDLLLTEDELREKFGKEARASRPLNPQGELAVNLIGNNERDFYRSPGEREISYTIDRASFRSPENANRVLGWLKDATGAWERACPECGIRFYPIDEASGMRPNFVVREVDEGGQYLASAFFPHYPQARRFLNIERSFYGTTFDKVGILRHELGHVLGYRHEHTRGIPGCYQEDNNWLPLTPYDPKSVMHYFCGGGGSLELRLSEGDVNGHRKLYAPPAKAAAIPEVVVRLEGSDTAGDAARAIGVLHALDVLPVRDHLVQEGETIETIYRDELGITGESALLTDLASRINRRNYLERPPAAGEIVRVPAVEAKPFKFLKNFDLTRSSEVRKLEEYGNLKVNITARKENEETGAIEGLLMTLRGFELRIPVDSHEKRNAAVQTIKKIQPGLIDAAEYPDPRVQGTVYSYVDKLWLDTINQSRIPKGEEIDLSRYSEPRTLPQIISDPCLDASVPAAAPGACGPLCPEIVIIDKTIRKHADIAASIVDGGETENAASPLDDGTQTIKHLAFKPDKSEHGTHLAGIVGARRNGFGIIGLDPEAEIASKPWVGAQAELGDLAEYVTDRVNRQRPQIFVFASAWMYRGENSTPTEDEAPIVLKKSADRFDYNRVASAIKEGYNGLWIVAAGNDGREITKTTGKGPMNLGDQKNVIVVTACDECFPVASLMDIANTSPDQNIVNVAAPGRRIPSTVTENGYAEADGTSQATAFVAGVASTMVRRWPSDYAGNPSRIKYRVELTSRPSLDLGMANRIGFGVVERHTALLNPRVHWFAKHNESNYVTAPALSWASTQVTFQERDGTQRLIPTADIRRIFRKGEFDWMGGGNRVTYAVLIRESQGGAPSVLTRVEPLVAIQPNQPLFSIQRTGCGEGIEPVSTYSLHQVQDLILSGVAVR